MRNAGDMAIRGTRQIRPLLAAAAAAAALVLVASCASRQAQPTPSSTAHDHPGASQPPAAPLRAGERFVNLTMPESYTPAAPNGGTDEYRCFLIDPRLTRTAFLTGSQFLPQNSDIVHHAIFFRIDPADADAARRLDASTPGQGWTCFGNAGIGRGAGWVAAWAPGADETLLDPGLGYSMPPGRQLVMQVHYNLVGTGGEPALRPEAAAGRHDLRPGRTHAPARALHQGGAQPRHPRRPNAPRHPGLQLRRPGRTPAGQ